MTKKSQKPSCFVTTLDISLADKLLEGLKLQGFAISVPQYTIFSGKKKGVSCTLYQSGKLTVQGKEMAEFIEFYLEPEILGDFSYTYKELDIDKTARIGIDESGKGDFFGPLCIAGVYAGGDDVHKLADLGVRDSKKIADNTILKIAKNIKKSYCYHVVAIGPAKYNELYQKFRNLNSLLAWGHATAIENLAAKSQCYNVIIDKFAAEHVVENALQRKNLDISLKQRHRAEEDLVVAAASIVARAAYLEGLEKLRAEFKMTFPKGASQKTIAAGKKFVLEYDADALQSVAKLHFSTYEKVVGQ